MADQKEIEQRLAQVENSPDPYFKPYRVYAVSDAEFARLDNPIARQVRAQMLPGRES